MKILTFYINNKKYGISIEHIVTIEKCDKEITPIPNTNEATIGVVNIRSKICPVIDLKAIIEGIKNDIDDTKKLVLFNYNEKNGAFLVDDTDNILNVEETDIELFDAGQQKYNIVNRNGEVIVLIEIEKQFVL